MGKVKFAFALLLLFPSLGYAAAAESSGERLARTLVATASGARNLEDWLRRLALNDDTYKTTLRYLKAKRANLKYVPLLTYKGSTILFKGLDYQYKVEFRELDKRRMIINGYQFEWKAQETPLQRLTRFEKFLSRNFAYQKREIHLLPQAHALDSAVPGASLAPAVVAAEEPGEKPLNPGEKLAKIFAANQPDYLTKFTCENRQLVEVTIAVEDLLFPGEKKSYTSRTYNCDYDKNGYLKTVSYDITQLNVVHKDKKIVVSEIIRQGRKICPTPIPSKCRENQNEDDQECKKFAKLAQSDCGDLDTVMPDFPYSLGRDCCADNTCPVLMTQIAERKTPGQATQLTESKSETAVQ